MFFESILVISNRLVKIIMFLSDVEKSDVLMRKDALNIEVLNRLFLLELLLENESVSMVKKFYRFSFSYRFFFLYLSFTLVIS